MAPGTKISIFTDVNGEKELVEDLTTDEKGNAYLYGYRKKTFYFLAEKNGAVNTIDGFVVNGIFENQEEIDNYILQGQSSQVGDLKFMDINQDGRVRKHLIKTNSLQSVMMAIPLPK